MVLGRKWTERLQIAIFYDNHSLASEPSSRENEINFHKWLKNRHTTEKNVSTLHTQLLTIIIPWHGKGASGGSRPKRVKKNVYDEMKNCLVKFYFWRWSNHKERVSEMIIIQSRWMLFFRKKFVFQQHCSSSSSKKTRFEGKKSSMKSEKQMLINEKRSTLRRRNLNNKQGTFSLMSR